MTTTNDELVAPATDLYVRLPGFTHVDKPKRLEDMTPDEAYRLGFREGAHYYIASKKD